MYVVYYVAIKNKIEAKWVLYVLILNYFLKTNENESHVYYVSFPLLVLWQMLTDLSSYSSVVRCFTRSFLRQLSVWPGWSCFLEAWEKILPCLYRFWRSPSFLRAWFSSLTIKASRTPLFFHSCPDIMHLWTPLRFSTRKYSCDHRQKVLFFHLSEHGHSFQVSGQGHLWEPLFYLPECISMWIEWQWFF